MRRLLLFVVLFLSGTLQAGENGTDDEAMNRKLKAELKGLEAKAAELENAAMTIEESIRIARVSKELMEGVRKESPQPKIVETQIYEAGVDAPVFFDATAGKVRNREVWLTDKMKAGGRYRFTCEVKTEDLKGTDRVKFMGYMPVKGAPTEWPGVGQTGSGSYGWTKLEFAFTLPHGGSFMLSFGSGEGIGKVWFRNIRGCEVAEVDDLGGVEAVAP